MAGTEDRFALIVFPAISHASHLSTHASFNPPPPPNHKSDALTEPQSMPLNQFGNQFENRFPPFPAAGYITPSPPRHRPSLALPIQESSIDRHEPPTPSTVVCVVYFHPRFSHSAPAVSRVTDRALFDSCGAWEEADMAVGMKVSVVLLAVAAMAMVAEAGKVYNVQWDIPTGDQYYSTIQGKLYNVGDTLKFTYMQGMHNVVKVGSVQDFTQCTVSQPLSPEFADGSTSMTLDTAGAHYFICSVPGHCSDGMKIKVLAVKHRKI